MDTILRAERGVLAAVGEDSTRIDGHMTPIPLCVTPATAIGETLEAMRRNGVVHAPVVDARGRPVGLVSEHMLHASEAPDSAPVKSVMQVDPLMVARDTSVIEVVGEMLERATRCALVVDAGTLCGIFSMSDALAAVLCVYLGHPGRSTPRAPTCDRWGHVISRT